MSNVGCDVNTLLLAIALQIRWRADGEIYSPLDGRHVRDRRRWEARCQVGSEPELHYVHRGSEARMVRF